MHTNADVDTDEYLAAVVPVSPAPETVSSRVQVDLGALSHAGKVRQNNEDHYLAARFDRSMRTLLTNLPAGSVPDRSAETAYGMLVADGMGGHAAGDFASETAIRVLVDLVLHTPDWIMRLDDDLIREVMKRMDGRFRQVRETLTALTREDPNLAGMGTTLTLACSLGADMILVHVGDSRVYLHRQGQLHRLTRDHTRAQQLADAGAIRPDEVARHPLRHVLTNALVTEGGEARTDLDQLLLMDGDRILLCTDGLTEMVEDAAIAETLDREESAQDACNALVEKALAAGGTDNVTVVLCHYRFPE